MTDETRTKAGKTVKVALKSLDNGDTVTYSCSGFHVGEEDSQYMTAKKNGEKGHKICPGEVIELPEDVAKKYLKTANGKRMLEIVND